MEPEKRGYSSDNDFWYNPFNFLSGGSETKAGSKIDEYRALTLPAYFCGIQIIAGTISALPLHLYQGTGRERRKAIEHPAYDIFHTQANEFMPAMSAREAMMAHILGWGNCYAEKVYDRAGRLSEIWPIQPHRVCPEIKNGSILYDVSVNGRIVTLDRGSIIHIAGLGYDGIMGYSIATVARESLGLGLAMEEFGARFFGAGTHPGAIAEHPGKLSPEGAKRLQASLQEKHAGLGKSHRLLLLEEGMTLKSVGIPPEDAQFLESRRFGVAEIARWLNLPPHKLKDLERATFSNIEQQAIEYVTDSLLPRCVKIEQNLNIQILTKSERKQGYYFKHSLEGLLRGDSEQRSKLYQVLWGCGALSPNDIREKEDLPPIDGGDIHLIPLNMISLERADDLGMAPQGGTSGAGEENSNPPPVERNGLPPYERRSGIDVRDRISARYYPLIREAAKRVINREAIAIKKQIGKQRNLRDIGQFNQWLDEFYDSLPEYIRNSLFPVFQSFFESVRDAVSEEVGTTFETAWPDAYACDCRYLEIYIRRHVDSSVGEIRNAMNQGEDIDDIEERVGKWSGERPDEIARNETARGSNFIATVGYLNAGLFAVWKIRGRTCPFCRSFEGKKIRKGEVFVKKGDAISPVDGDQKPMKITRTMQHPPLHKSCDCFVGWSR